MSGYKSEFRHSKRLNIKLILIFLSLFVFNQSYAKKSLEVSIFDESYPSSDVTPHAQGISLLYSYDDNDVKHATDTNTKKTHLSYDVRVSLEKDAQIYDSDRDPISLHFNLNKTRTLKTFKYNINTSAIAGINIEENGPQINDRHYMAHTGLQLEKSANTVMGNFSIKASAEYAYVFFEVDDEPAQEQTGAAKETLDHVGFGTLLNLDIRYDKGKNRIRAFASRVKANDKAQNISDYEREINGIEISRKIAERLRCGIKFSTIEHKYKPVVLNFKDELFQTSASCSYSFNHNIEFTPPDSNTLSF